MNLISVSAQYAVSALLILAKSPNEDRISASELSRQSGAPMAYLSQMLAKLIPLGIFNPAVASLAELPLPVRQKRSQFWKLFRLSTKMHCSPNVCWVFQDVAMT